MCARCFLGVVRAAALFYPRAQWSPGARRGPRPWATPPWGSSCIILNPLCLTRTKLLRGSSIMGMAFARVCYEPKACYEDPLFVNSDVRYPLHK